MVGRKYRRANNFARSIVRVRMSDIWETAAPEPVNKLFFRIRYNFGVFQRPLFRPFSVADSSPRRRHKTSALFETQSLRLKVRGAQRRRILRTPSVPAPNRPALCCFCYRDEANVFRPFPVASPTRRMVTGKEIIHQPSYF